MADTIQNPPDEQVPPYTQIRLDVLLTQSQLVRSRTEAQELIASGQVTVDGVVVLKPGRLFSSQSKLEILGQQRRFVSRGGEKLEAALVAFDIPVDGKKCLDVGASTGGFTDCLLQRGAARITAIDVGHGQLDPAIANNPKVDSREGVHVRHMTKEDLPEEFDLVVVDLSFISLRLVLPVLLQFLSKKGDLVCLVKPQFEVGREGLGKGGIVRNTKLRNEAVDNVQQSAKTTGYTVLRLIESPLRGGDGNTEYLLWLRSEDNLC